MMINELFRTGPISVVDLETTGTDTKTARPVEVAAMRLDSWDAEHARMFCERCNPGLRWLRSPEFESAVAIHGIKAEDVADCPSPEDVIAAIVPRLQDCAVVGYNIVEFDLKVTPALETGPVVDVFRLVQKLAEECPRPSDPTHTERDVIERHPEGLKGLRHSLGGMYAALTYGLHDDAHSAAADVVATWQVLEALLLRWDTYLRARLPAVSWAGLAEYLAAPPAGWSDWRRSFVRHGDLWVCGFGKHKGLPLKALPRDYLRWMMREDFPATTLDLIRSYL